MLLEWQYVQAKHRFIFKQFWTKSTQAVNNIFLLFYFILNYSHICDTERKKGGFVVLILEEFSFWVNPSWKRLILMNCTA